MPRGVKCHTSANLFPARPWFNLSCGCMTKSFFLYWLVPLVPGVLLLVVSLVTRLLLGCSTFYWVILLVPCFRISMLRVEM